MEAKQIAEEASVTEKLFYEDSYMEKFTARVISCNPGGKGYRVVLDRTAFFPEGGGQFGDTGYLGEIRVLDTQEKNGVIYHETEAPVEAGTAVEGKIDFEKRFDRMQQHTGEHIISGIVHGLYGYDNVGFHLGDDLTTLDFNGELTPEQIQETEMLANRAVFEDLPVEVLYPDKAALGAMEYRSKIEIGGQVRIVAIPGVDMCACCAPHTRTTGAVGMIKILSCDRHRGGCRVTMVSGMRALTDYRSRQQSVTEISVALSSKPEKITEAVLHLKEQQLLLRSRLNQMQAVYLKGKLDAVTAEVPYVCIFEEEMDNVAVRNFVNDAMERCSGICAAFVGTDADGYHYILGSGGTDVRILAKKLNEAFAGKGGGKPGMVQGSLTGKKEEIESVLAQLATGL